MQLTTLYFLHFFPPFCFLCQARGEGGTENLRYIRQAGLFAHSSSWEKSVNSLNHYQHNLRRNGPKRKKERKRKRRGEERKGMGEGIKAGKENQHIFGR